jgi:hypothetical protein
MSKEHFAFIKKYEVFKGSSQNQFYSFIRENRLNLSILMENYVDINQIVKFHNSPDNDKVLWMNLNPRIRWRTQVKVIKALLNYLTCVFSVIEYSRKDLAPYLQKEANIYKAYQQRVKLDFELNSLHRFIQGLRNYTIHYSHLKIVSYIHYDRDLSESSRNIYIPKSILLKFKNWDKQALSYLNTLDDKVYIIDIIIEHYKNFIQFQNWAFLNLFLVDYKFSARVYEELQALLNEATSLGLNYNLPFDKVYLRYYKYILSKSLALGLTSE